MKSMLFRFFAPLAFVAFALPLNLPAQEKEGEEKPADEKKVESRLDLELSDYDLKRPVAKNIDVASKKITRRLPNGYSKLVSAAQREEIYKIQSTYHPLITFLTLRLEQLKLEQDEKIKAVLNDEQKKTLGTKAGAQE